MIKNTISPSNTKITIIKCNCYDCRNIDNEELKLLKLRRVQLEAELTNINLRINKLNIESDKLLNEVKNGN
jgi:hypothetical protein